MSGTYGGSDDYADSGDLDDDTPFAPFGATLKGVKALVPTAELVTGPTAIGKYGVRESEVVEWLRELSGMVAMRLDGWERLSSEPSDLEVEVGEVPPDSDREQLRRAARTIVHNGAASYLEAARHPEQAQANTTNYAAVLWARYEERLDTLATWLTGRLARPETGDVPDSPATGILGNFPAPLFGDGLRF